jgi:hypothetical protein
MISLLEAAEDYQQALQRVEELFRNIRSYVRAGTMTEAEALANLELMTSPAALLSSPMTSPVAIAVERRHFNSNAKANIRAKKKQERKRREKGIAPRFETPHEPTAEDLLAGLPELTQEDLEKIKQHPDTAATRHQQVTLPPPDELAASPAPDFLPEDFDDETDEATLPPE